MLFLMFTTLSGRLLTSQTLSRTQFSKLPFPHQQGRDSKIIQQVRQQHEDQA